MEPVCFLCQEYKANISHETSTCPYLECKKCGQKGHFRWDCLVNIAKDGVLTQPEICSIKEIKSENCIKTEIEIENMASDEFSRVEEQSLMYCMESIPPHEFELVSDEFLQEEEKYKLA